MPGDADALAGLRALFPSEGNGIGLPDVEALRGPLGTAHVVPPDPADRFAADFATAKPLPGEDAAVVGYYRAEASHRRLRPVTHWFVGVNQWVRVRLPQKGSVWTIGSRIGMVHARDHLLKSAAAAAQKFNKRLDFPIERMELMTAARFHGARFGVGSLYLLYDAANAVRAYVAEGGGAFGQPQALYLGPAFGTPFTDSSRFIFTAMADVDHLYRYTLQGGAEPTSMRFEAFLGPEARDPYLVNDIAFRPIDAAEIERTGVYTPQSQQRVAANRVAQIGGATEKAGHRDWVEHGKALNVTEALAALLPARPTWGKAP